MIDTHCHLNDNSYDTDRNEVINSAFTAGMEFIIVPTTKPADFRKTLEIAEENEKIYCTIGVHPHNAKEVNDTVLENIKKIASNDKVVAIGEIGLDYHYDYSPQDAQLFAFRRQIEIANELSLPIIVHNRESDYDMISILEKYFPTNKEENEKLIGGVFHCYSSDLLMLNKILDMGFFVSFTANITFPKNNMDEVIANVPLERLMLETDSPYMTPPPNRGKRNIPQNVKIVAEKISNIKNISIDEVIKMTNANAKKLFGLSLCSLVFILGAFFFDSNELYSQTNIDADDDYYDDYHEQDPYTRRLGFGPLFGANTFIDRYTTGNRSFSHEGIFSYGGLVNFRVLDYLIIQGAYMYSYNTNYVDRLDDTTKHWLDPNYHHAIELNVLGMSNAYQMVNFYASIGATYFMNKLSRNLQGEKMYIDDNKIGLNAGIGIFINFSLGNAGTLVVNGEWKFGFRLDKIELDYDPRLSPIDENYSKITKYSSMSSIPRGGIIWYIPFLK